MTPGKGTEAQARLAFQALQSVLEAAGATLADVVELTTFHTNLRGEMRAFARVKDAYFPDRYPSWTAVGVTELALPELCVEIRRRRGGLRRSLTPQRYRMRPRLSMGRRRMR